MIKRIKKSLLLSFLLLTIPFLNVQAAKGLPDSGEFGYGAHIDIHRNDIDQTLQLVKQHKLDWIAIDLAWAKFMPEHNSTPDWSDYDYTLQFAQRNGIVVLLRLTEPPTWAQTQKGPGTNQCLQLIEMVIERYPSQLQAIELFPGANLSQSWGAEPNPSDYANLFKTVHQRLVKNGSDVLLITGGLKSLSPENSASGMNDLTYLQGLYDTGIANILSVISIQMSETTGDPLSLPNSSEHRVLRHYEEIRHVMLENNHEVGMIWITELTPPMGNLQSGDQIYSNMQEQSKWMTNAVNLLKSQLYIGTGFINTSDPDYSQEQGKLISQLESIIPTNSPDEIANKQGRHKSETINKGQPEA